LARGLKADDQEVRPLLDHLGDAPEVVVVGSPRPAQDVVAIVEDGT